MLDPHGADLVDAVARLCVLRTEDYTLLLTAHRRTVQQQQQELQHVAGHTSASPLERSNRDGTSGRAAAGGTGATGAQLCDNKAYIRYLATEVQAREQLRLATEKAWLASVQRWARCFIAGQAAPPDAAGAHCAELVHRGAASASPGDIAASLPSSDVPAIWGFWAARQEVAFQQMYAAVLRQSYELQHTDLANTPFARMHGCQQLYDARAATPPAPVNPPTASPSDASSALHRFPEVHVQCVHRLFFPPTSASSANATALPPSRLLAAVHPIRAGEEVTTFTDASRTRLQASHHVWLVLFFLWCHVVAAGREAASAPLDDDVVAWQAAALLHPAENFLSTQARQLRTLLETAHASTEVEQAAS